MKSTDNWKAIRSLIELRNQAPPLVSLEPTESHFPLSLSQDRLWALERLNLGVSLYNMPCAFRLKSELNLSALVRSLETVISHQPALRTIYGMVNGQPKQIIQPVKPVLLNPIDLFDLPDAPAQTQIISDLQQPFDLEYEPGFRYRLYRLVSGEYVLGFTFHHIAFDYWSLSLFFKELNSCYEAYTHNVEPVLRKLPVGYGDFAVWQRQWLRQSGVLEHLLGFWQPQLQGVTSPLLPVDYSSAAAQVQSKQVKNFVIPAEHVDTLKQFVKQAKVSLFDLLLTGFKVLLRSLSPTDDLAICTPVISRHRPELQHLIGDFTNLLILRTDMSGQPTSLDLLHRVSQTVSAALAHQDMPLQFIQSHLRFQLPKILFAFLNTPQATLQLSGVDSAVWYEPTGSNDFDLFLVLEEKGSTIKAFLKYNANLWSETTIVNWLETYQELLNQLTSQPDQPVASLLPNMPPASATKTAISSTDDYSITEVAVQVRQEIEGRSYNQTETDLSYEALKAWLIAWVSDKLKVEPKKINLHQPFSEYGITSLFAINLVKDLSRWVGRQLEPIILWSYPSISDLTAFVVGKPSDEALEQPTFSSPAVPFSLLNELRELPKPIAPSTMEAALSTIQTLQHKLTTVQQRLTEPIAIIGLSCRFPGKVDTPAAFWQLLQNGIDPVGKIPAERWNLDLYYDPNPNTPGKMYVHSGSFLGSEIEQFDPQFFGVSPVDAAHLDPQQRLLIELSWEALEHAGISASQLRESQTGVFIGAYWDNYPATNFYASPPEQLDGHHLLSSLRGMQAGRLAYILGVHGPAMQLDTACSSSLLALHVACQSLRQGEADLALVGGADLNLSPSRTISLCRMQVLSPDGRCKTFDAQADGFGQAEGAAMVVLKRLSDAIKDGDSVFALIRGSAVNHDGASNGLTAPNRLAQEALLRQALSNADIDPDDIQYIEAHGTGTQLGDPIEMAALKSVFAVGRHSPLLLGSVKSNIGHTGAAAGVASLLKVVLALQHGEIPPNLHFETPNPHIAWAETPFVVPTKRTLWPKGNGPRVAGISSFGMTGTNVHVIVEEFAPAKADLSLAKQNQLERSRHLLCLSAQSHPALQELLERYITHLTANPECNLADICSTANRGRVHFAHRLAIIATDSVDLQQKLLSLHKQNKPTEPVQELGQGAPPKIAFLFTGQGSQYVNMGRELYETQPKFRAVLERGDQLLQAYLGKSLLEILYPANGDHCSKTANGANHLSLNANPIDQTTYTQPALFVLEVALATLWQSWGIQPEILIGHSVGEVAAACVAGVFSLEDGLKLIATRGRLMGALPQDGEMVSLSMDEARVRQAIAPYHNDIAIAAVNGAQSIVISGKRQAVLSLSEELASEGIKTRKLTVSHAFHSPLMQPILDEFRKVAATITYHKPKLRLVSNVTGEIACEEVTTPDYWVRHVCDPVRFADGIATLHEHGTNIFLEIGPKPTLLGMAQSILDTQDAVPVDKSDGELSGTHHNSAKPSMLPSLRENQSDWQQMLMSLSELYLHAIPIDWEGFEKDYQRRKVILPTYPFQRQRYWVEHSAHKTNGQLSTQQTPLVNLLNQGDLAQLMQMVQDGQAFSTEERALLPKLLERLVQQQTLQRNASKVDDWLYEVVWRAQERPVQSEAANANGQWLILADQGGWGYALAQQLAAKGGQPLLVYANRAASNGWLPVVVVDPADVNALQQLLSAQNNPQMIRGVIHLWGLDMPNMEGLTEARLQETQMVGCGSLLHLVQWLGRTAFAGGQRVPKLWVMTQNAQALPEAEVPLSVTQSSLWGLGRTIALEHQELWGGIIDLDAGYTPTTPTIVSQVLAEFLGETSESQLALRKNGRHVARLARCIPSAGVIPIDSSAAYLISGGLGGLGLQVARWLADNGARYLCLTSRRGVTTTMQQQMIGELERKGVTVQIAKVDMADAGAISTLLTELAAASIPLRGIIHTAGVLDDSVLLNQEWSRFQTVMAPKVQGSWHLHRLTQAMPLDFFIMFSSVASVFGNMGQGNYAAANSFMDGLAHYRRQKGLPALSINWGPWAEAGMGARLEKLQLHGMTAMQPTEGCMALQRLISTAGNCLVSPIDWSQFDLASVSGQAFVSDWRKVEDKSSVQPVFAEQLRKMPASERYQSLISYLQAQVSQVLWLNEPAPRQQGFADMGMDSLMALKLKHRLENGLGKALPTTIALEYPTLERMANYLLDDVLELPITHVSVADEMDVVSVTDTLDDLSQDELAQLLAHKLGTFAK
ncbi:MAG: SDR family NAD(P)-dependent oxidoreductase [Caldilineaceae bacterium]